MIMDLASLIHALVVCGWLGLCCVWSKLIWEDILNIGKRK